MAARSWSILLGVAVQGPSAGGDRPHAVLRTHARTPGTACARQVPDAQFALQHKICATATLGKSQPNATRRINLQFARALPPLIDHDLAS